LQGDIEVDLEDSGASASPSKTDSSGTTDGTPTNEPPTDTTGQP
jgi:hypothetical protein